MSWLSTPAHSVRSLAQKGVKNWVRRSFPSVPAVSTATLADWLQKETAKPLLIDVRPAEEYAVSHLPHAHRAKTVAEAERIIQQNSSQQSERDEPVVLYCSVGYRSARLAKALQSAGYEVINLEGSIFEWANEGREMVSDYGPTQQVHPYNRVWGWLLKSDKRGRG